MLITPRQAEILNTIVEIYSRTAEPVGSQALVERFGTSSATIRADMAALEDGGYIYQPHISAGRVPTDKGYRAYVNSLADSDRTSLRLTPDPALRRMGQLIARRLEGAGRIEEAIKAAVSGLAESTSNLALATLTDGLYLRGMANLFSHPEFQGGEEAHEVARLIDSLDEWFDEYDKASNRVSVLIGRENPVGKASGASVVVGRFRSPYREQSYIGILGPTRQNYPAVIELVDHTSQILEEAFNA
jgi:heat-inducible transcriptional repressor